MEAVTIPGGSGQERLPTSPVRIVSGHRPPIPGGSGKERFVESHRAKLTAAARRPEGTRGNFPLENCEVRRFWLVRNGWSRLLGLLGYGGRRKGLGAIFRWKIERFGAFGWCETDGAVYWGFRVTGAAGRDSGQFSVGKLRGSAPSSRRRPQSTGLRDLIVRVPCGT